MAPTTGTSARAKRCRASATSRSIAARCATATRRTRTDLTLELQTLASGDREAPQHHWQGYAQWRGAAAGREQSGARATAEHRRPVSPEPAREGRPHLSGFRRHRGSFRHRERARRPAPAGAGPVEAVSRRPRGIALDAPVQSARRAHAHEARRGCFAACAARWARAISAAT